MKAPGWPDAAGLVAAGVLLATTLVAASAALVPDAPRAMALPTAGELMELQRYLDPAESDASATAGVPETVVVQGDPFRIGATRWAGWGGATEPTGGNGGDGAAAGRPGSGSRPGAEAPQRPRWTLSAILIAGERRIAIVNDLMVRPGDRLEDGTRVEVVERNHVVIITPNGERRRLELEGQSS